MRSIADKAIVHDLLARGYSDRVVADLSGVPSNTIGRWRRSWPPIAIRWQPAHEPSYAYLLGMYLGDGCLSAGRGRVLLRISLDSVYPAVIDDCWTAMVLCMPDRRAGLVRRDDERLTVVQSSSKRWLNAFPQHGKGRKHERAIVLDDWQRVIVARHPGEFVRGLIHSDGCRTTNRFRTTLPSGRLAEYAYGRYFFSNLSGDIRGLFCGACDALGVRWTMSNPRNISVAYRPSVARLDELGCRKD